MLKTTDLKEACVLQASSLLGRLLLYETLKCSLFGHWPSPRRVGGHKKSSQEGRQPVQIALLQDEKRLCCVRLPFLAFLL